MQKPKPWEFFLIVIVMCLTIYNILPTVFFYSKPLKSPITEKQAQKIASSIAKRVNQIEKDNIDWLHSFCKLLVIKPTKIQIDESNSRFIHLTFNDLNDSQKFRKYLPRAGQLIGFIPSQLALYDIDPSNKKVTVQRRIGVHIEKDRLSDYFQFGEKRDLEGQPTAFYKAIVNDRILSLATNLSGASEQALSIQSFLQTKNDIEKKELALIIVKHLLSFAKIFNEKSLAAQRYFQSFSQIEVENRKQFIEDWIGSLEKVRDDVRLERISLSEQKSLNEDKQQKFENLSQDEDVLTQALVLIRKNLSSFSQGKSPLVYTQLAEQLKTANLETSGLHLNNQHPFISSISVDWTNEKILIQLHSDLVTNKNNPEIIDQEKFERFIYNDLAQLSCQSGEHIQSVQDRFEISLSNLTDSHSFLALRLFNIAKNETQNIKNTLTANWLPKHPDLKRVQFPIWDFETYQTLPIDQKKLGLIIFSPSMQNPSSSKGFKMNSVYVIVKGIEKIANRFEATPESELAKQLATDFKELQKLLQKNGFVGYKASKSLGVEFDSDFIFEHENYYQDVLKATRENFIVQGTKRYAFLELSNLEQRILTENKIDNSIHEDLIKWKDDYTAAQLDLKGVTKYDVPSPTKNILWNNICLSYQKYFRGDDRKILSWGLDLSGGKTVQLELRDNQNQIVTNDSDIRQGINELYVRVNKMGITEVTIRQEGHTIAIDFPGSQSLTAQELVKASSMFFHVVNEKFMTNPMLSSITHQFLQEVWNEAVVTNRKTPEDIHLIAYNHLYGENGYADQANPKSMIAKTLYENGLRLPSLQEYSVAPDLDETYSKIALLRGNDFTQWYGSSHPLMIVFQNYALEGSSLESVHASYDSSKGNFLSFEVKNSHLKKDGTRFSPKDNLQAWTSQFAKDQISESLLAQYSQNQGWRMAVILNGTIITAPQLEAVLRDRASITGNFTQREINQLETDLRAGSLTFTPKILSEKNVSPELGAQERFYGVIAMVCALGLAILAMIGYYRFSGLIASIAVVFNLLILWATLQNIGATLTLAGIAGIILTVAMAIDANVLVFERIREEFALSGRLTTAIQAGYQKALSAIIDSNVTTIAACLILLNFDSGPVKGFAVTLIIGIISSLFTALFMTRVFFNWWVQNPKNRELKMFNFIKGSNFNFLKLTKPTLIVSAIVICIGCYFLWEQKQNILGMDFTGGNSLILELPITQEKDYRGSVEKALLKQGLHSQDFQIRELHPTNHVRIFIKSFKEQPISSSSTHVFPYDTNPQINWIVQSLKASNINLSHKVLENLDTQWTAISGQMSESMKMNALIALSIALLSILCYITLRFEFKYALSATLCLIHDVMFCLSFVAILHRFGMGIQIDLHTIAALMTIVGYSLNDTIIIFDRIREDLQHMRKLPLSSIINYALNVTLSRTLMTSGTTLIVLIPLIILGGSTIFGFALVMVLGVVCGTLSSLFIAAPLMQYFHEKELRKQERLRLNEQ